MTYNTEFFALSLPQGNNQNDVVALLRHLADDLEKERDLIVRDLVFHKPIDDDGNFWPSFTVYCQRKNDDTNA